jgi:predicted HD superfamily hydrolase involved in NAD metabolism
MAEKLARRYGASPLKARLAGLVHDVARSWSGSQLLSYARMHGIAVSPEAEAAPVLLHAAAGADVARREFGIDDAEILGAIRRHTVAGPNMTTLEKTVYLADTIEPSRTFDGRAALEAKAFASLDGGLLESVKESLKYLVLRQVPIAQETIQLYNELVRRNGVAS